MGLVQHALDDPGTIAANTGALDGYVRFREKRGFRRDTDEAQTKGIGVHGQVLAIMVPERTDDGFDSAAGGRHYLGPPLEVQGLAGRKAQVQGFQVIAGLQ